MSTPAPLGIRSNNPWNLQNEHVPYIGIVNYNASGELVFDTMPDGIRAGVLCCYAYQREGYNTPRLFVPRFSPSKAGNPTVQYLSNVCLWTGFGADQLLDFHDPKIIRPWSRAIWRQEQGLAYSQEISFEDLEAGIAAAN